MGAVSIPPNSVDIMWLVADISNKYVGVSGKRYIFAVGNIAIDVDRGDAEEFVINGRARYATPSDRNTYQGYLSRQS